MGTAFLMGQNYFSEQIITPVEKLAGFFYENIERFTKNSDIFPAEVTISTSDGAVIISPEQFEYYDLPYSKDGYSPAQEYLYTYSNDKEILIVKQVLVHEEQPAASDPLPGITLNLVTIDRVYPWFTLIENEQNTVLLSTDEQELLVTSDNKKLAFNKKG